MKKLLIAGLLFLTTLLAQDDNNVMSYYASDNNLDGQPRIDMMNVLRFFPVFAIQENITDVSVTIFYGDNIYTGNADKMNGGQYWQTMLPDFNLGDALQRIEVEMTTNLNDKYRKKIEMIKDSITTTESNINTLTNLNEIEKKSLLENIEIDDSIKLESLQDSFKVKIYGFHFGTFRKMFYEIGKNTRDYLNKSMPDTAIINSVSRFLDSNSTTKNIPGYEDKRKAKRESYLSYVNILINNKELVKRDFNFINNEIKQIINERKKLIDKSKNELENNNIRLEKVLVETKEKLLEEIVGELSDSSFSGPAIRKSDLVISHDFKSAILLYRYYKNNLRYRKALDPAESLGIFRARYIPFPVVGRPGDTKLQLLRPAQAKTPVVFEVGLAFGDEVVSGDNTFKPAFSLARLGVAIVITEKLFKDDAEILGLAFTYDFNSYASIGAGRNLAQGQSYPYYSFGINRKAFEQLLIGLAGLFK